MIASFQIPFRILKAAVKFASVDETRYVINGVRVEITPGKPISIVATDGRRLVHATPDVPFEADAPCAFIIPSCAIQCVDFSNTDTGIGDDGAEYSFPADAAKVEFDGRLVTIDFLKKGFQVRVPTIDGTYPNWRGVIPSPMPTAFPEKQVPLNREFLLSMLSCVDDLTHHNGVSIVSSDGETPIVMLAERLMLILMPLKSDALSSMKPNA